MPDSGDIAFTGKSDSPLSYHSLFIPSFIQHVRAIETVLPNISFTLLVRAVLSESFP